MYFGLELNKLDLTYKRLDFWKVMFFVELSKVPLSARTHVQPLFFGHARSLGIYAYVAERPPIAEGVGGRTIIEQLQYHGKDGEDQLFGFNDNKHYV